MTVVIALLYASAVVFLAWNENRLVYPGAPTNRGNWEPTHLNHEEVQFESKDGTQLVGWFLPAPRPDTQPKRYILHCHGNAENVALVAVHSGEQFRDSLNADVFVFDYRGYGKSEGSPDESGIYDDSVAALEQLCQRSGCQPKDVILIGHSLGGGPAVYLAKEKGCKLLILQRTFSSLPDAASNTYPIFPVHWIMKNRMESAERIRDCPQPLFQSHGNADSLIPIEHAKRLHANSPATIKQFFEVDGMDHWAPLPPNYWKQVTEFVQQVEASSADKQDPADDKDSPKKKDSADKE